MTANTTTTTTLGCPSCRRSDKLATVEQILGHSGLNSAVRETNGDVEIDFDGYTEMFWETSTTVGVHCAGCGFDYLGDDWADQLIAV